MKSALVETATSVLGYEQRKHPDWFRDNMEVREPLLQKGNNLYFKWLGASNALDHHMYAEACAKAWLAVQTAKNKWFVAIAEEPQKPKFDGKMWKCITEMQRGRSGLAPMKTAIAADDDGVPCVTTSVQKQQCRHHFTKVLNFISSVDAVELEKIEQRPY
ncbi:uncharacterized protein LOC134189931 [Corticium candelabrum]|uniref:uncharacterized protein LOC134189931 n=1 Tax=Corticium candelabrum TaxID=121492 RepID=UPI002E25F707|nr:uncharacterized protein LOC134189931 [Corticium candelabrum]